MSACLAGACMGGRRLEWLEGALSEDGIMEEKEWEGRGRKEARGG